MLVSAGYLVELDAAERGRWREQTQAAVLEAYRGIGWEHPSEGRWITAPALAAIAAASHAHVIVRNESTSRNGKAAAGPGSHAGGPGSHAGGPGSHAGGPGSHAGGPGSHAS